MAAALAVASAAIATGAVTREAPDPCAAPTARLAGVWGLPRVIATQTRLVAADPDQGAARFARIAAVLDTGARSWTAMHVDACRATRVEHRQSDALLDLRMACLDRWLGELDRTIAEVEQVRDRGAVDHAVGAAIELSPLQRCADGSALSEAQPPLTADGRATAGGLIQQAQAIDIAQRAGRLDGLVARARTVVEAARKLDHAPTLATTLATLARVEIAVGHVADSEATLRELAQVAARAHDDRDAAFAWRSLIRLIGFDDGKPEQALALVPAADAAVLRAGDPADLRAELLYSQATVLDWGPHPAEGLALLLQARSMFEKAGGNDPTSPFAPRLADVVFETGTSHARQGHIDAALASLRDAIERWRAIFGPDSADEAFGWQNLGAVLTRAAKPEESLAAFRNAARIREARIGESPTLAVSLVAVASALSELGRWDEALAIYDRALRIDRQQLPPGDLATATVLLGRGLVLGHLKRLDEATQSYDDAIAMYEKAGAKKRDFQATLFNRADIAARRGNCEEALRFDARATALAEEIGGPKSGLLLYSLVGGAACLVRLGRPAEAIAPLERALGLDTDPAEHTELARTRYFLGRARVETRRDVAGGLAMVRAARVDLAEDPEEVRDLDRWLAAHSR